MKRKDCTFLFLVRIEEKIARETNKQTKDVHMVNASENGGQCTHNIMGYFGQSLSTPLRTVLLPFSGAS